MLFDQLVIREKFNRKDQAKPHKRTGRCEGVSDGHLKEWMKR